MSAFCTNHLDEPLNVRDSGGVVFHCNRNVKNATLFGRNKSGDKASFNDALLTGVFAGLRFRARIPLNGRTASPSGGLIKFGDQDP